MVCNSSHFFWGRFSAGRFAASISAVRGVGGRILPAALFVIGGVGAFSQKAAAQAGSPAPDQAHVMADVGYHFGNLWFAGTNQNWPLASYYLDTTRAHLAWAVQVKPVYVTKAGDQVNLGGILEAVTNTILKSVATAIEKKDEPGFETAYKQTIAGCYACHTAAEKPFLKVRIPEFPSVNVINISGTEEGAEAGGMTDEVSRGKAFFRQNCALCHAAVLGPRNNAIGGQGPSLVGVAGRRAGSGPNFNYTKALADSGLVWNAEALNRFLANPVSAVPGTTMLVSVPDETNRRNLVAYLATLKAEPGAVAASTPAPAAPNPETDEGDWHHAKPGVKHRVDVATLPPPFATPSAGNGPKVVPAPPDAKLSVPPNFTVKQFASGLSGPRLLRTAPNGDIFIAETGQNRIRVMRTTDGADAPAENQIFVSGLNRPFGMAFYPPGPDPKWMYIANNNSIVRVPYSNGDLKTDQKPEVIVPHLANTTGGHTTRDVAFTKDGKRMFITVGSGSNVAEEMKKKEPDAIREWEAERGLGAAWDTESNRANILITDPEGKTPMHPYATGVRNGAVLAIHPDTGDLWVSTNERDGLGDDLVPDYITHLKEGCYYGWPWYYMGNHEDPRHAGERPDLAGKATIPDVPLQAHSASLGIAFYTAASGVSAFPAEYQGDIFACFHGSWNRNNRTGYKVVRVHCKNGVATGEYEDFMTGFVVDNASVWGRPVGVTVAHDGALLITDDGNNTMWRISYNGK